jgi:hypothetical protein
MFYTVHWQYCMCVHVRVYIVIITCMQKVLCRHTTAIGCVAMCWWFPRNITFTPWPISHSHHVQYHIHSMANITFTPWSISRSLHGQYHIHTMTNITFTPWSISHALHGKYKYLLKLDNKLTIGLYTMIKCDVNKYFTLFKGKFDMRTFDCNSVLRDTGENNTYHRNTFVILENLWLRKWNS